MRKHCVRLFSPTDIFLGFVTEEDAYQRVAIGSHEPLYRGQRLTGLRKKDAERSSTRHTSTSITAREIKAAVGLVGTKGEQYMAAAKVKRWPTSSNFVDRAGKVNLPKAVVVCAGKAYNVVPRKVDPTAIYSFT